MVATSMLNPTEGKSMFNRRVDVHYIENNRLHADEAFLRTRTIRVQTLSTSRFFSESLGLLYLAQIFSIQLLQLNLKAVAGLNAYVRNNGSA